MPSSKDPERYPPIFADIGDACERRIERLDLPFKTPNQASHMRYVWYSYIRAHQHEINRLRDLTYRTKSTDPAFKRITENNDLEIRRLETRLRSLKRYRATVRDAVVTLRRDDTLEEFTPAQEALNKQTAHIQNAPLPSDNVILSELGEIVSPQSIVKEDDIAQRVLGDFMSTHKPIIPIPDEDDESSATTTPNDESSA